MKLALIAVFAGVFAYSSAEDGSSSPCLELSSCMKTAAEKFEECQSLLEEEGVMRPRGRGGRRGGRRGQDLSETSQECREELKDLFAKKKEAHEEKSRMFESCIESRLEDLAEDGESVPEMSQRKCERRSERVQQKIERRMERRERKAGNRRRAGRMSEFKQCMQEVRQIKQDCKKVAGCCSEAAICHLEYEMSDVHDTIKGLQLDIILSRRECKKASALEGEVFDSDVVPDDLVIDADL